MDKDLNLVSARRIYQAAIFILTKEEKACTVSARICSAQTL